MSKFHVNEYQEWMYHTYGDLADLVKEQGAGNVLQDLEDLHPQTYEKLVQAVIERARINKEKPCLLLQTPANSNGESR